MQEQRSGMAPHELEVPMVDPEVVRQVKELVRCGWGSKRIAAELGIARNTVKRYLRGAEAGVQVRPGARALSEADVAEAQRLFTGVAEGNAVVVQELLAKAGVEAGVRTVQRAVKAKRRDKLVKDLASIRFETAPGHQMQIDFGQKRVRVAGEEVVVHLLVAVLGYSRRLFAKAFLSERQDDWREGIAEAFLHFGGVPVEVVGDNARALVYSRDLEARTVQFQPAFREFCRDWGVVPRACAPYHARSKGKVESGVKYVKRNGLAGREFASFAELEAHLTEWIASTDHRRHGSTGETPLERFLREEVAALRPLPARPVPVREQRLRRVVANDARVDVDSVRYSVPFQLIRDRVEVHLGKTEVRIFHGGGLVALHVRSFEPKSEVINREHFAGLHRIPAEAPSMPAEVSPLEALGRSLADYAELIERGAA